MNYCCTMPDPGGFGNITNAPLFVDAASGNLHLQPNSPCINAGLNAYAAGLTDPEGNPRIAGGTVDIGAYEFQRPAWVIPIAWLQQYGLATDGSADALDPDGYGLNNWQEWRCDTNPTNALSVLRLLAPVCDGTNVTVSWESVTGVSYFLERSMDLAASPPFTLLATNLAGQAEPQTLLRPLLPSPRLSARGPPRVRTRSFRSCLWALRDAVNDFGALWFLAHSPAASRLIAHLCSFGRAFAFCPFAPAPCDADLAVRLRLSSFTPSGTFHPDRPCPCRAHQGRPAGASGWARRPDPVALAVRPYQ